LGRIKTNQQRNVLVRGHIFINTSLTESFCIAIVEAASCGLYVVSTNVGGVTEVLPKNMVSFANPEPNDIIEKLSNAMSFAKNIPSH
jgi:phosphatidylinositol glycan class A protein